MNSEKDLITARVFTKLYTRVSNKALHIKILWTCQVKEEAKNYIRLQFTNDLRKTKKSMDSVTFLIGFSKTVYYQQN